MLDRLRAMCGEQGIRVPELWDKGKLVISDNDQELYDWFQTDNPNLQNRSPLTAILEGDYKLVGKVLELERTKTKINDEDEDQ